MSTGRAGMWYSPSCNVAAAAVTHVGHKRSVNEDAYYCNPVKGIWAVADGMGGYAAGDVASQSVIMALRSAAKSGSFEMRISAVKQAIMSANQHLRSELTIPSGCRQLGTTIVVLLMDEDSRRCACLWVGDSRLYALRNQNLFQLSKDHSLVQEMVDRGLLEDHERDGHPQSNIITRAVGIEDNLDIDVVEFEMLPGDLYILCSDGLYGELPPGKLLALLQDQGADIALPDQRCRWATRTLLSAVLDTKARDNVTINVIAISE